MVMKIMIDGDACPVKKNVMTVAKEYELRVQIVTSVAHFSLKELPDFVETIYVDTGAESADYRIVQLLAAGDILVTQDYGLASLALAKGAIVLHHLGFEYTSDNIEQLLESRYLSALVRKSGKRTKGPKPFTEQDRQKFQEQLIRKIEEVA